ncbi:hypothetical protein D1007_12418 [Hordeum vulgare]|nr:hypothetical protein D1007_12418 [Hordeum vulgare]
MLMGLKKDTLLNSYHGEFADVMYTIVSAIAVVPGGAGPLPRQVPASEQPYTVPKLRCLNTKKMKRSGNQSSSEEQVEGVVGLLGAADGIRPGSAAFAAREHQDSQGGSA